MHSVHHEAHDVCARHSGQLFGDNVLQINQIAHILQRLVVTHDQELDQALFLLTFDLYISFTSTKASLETQKEISIVIKWRKTQ